MYLVLAIILGVYLCGKIATDKSSAKRADINYKNVTEDAQRDFDSFKARYEDVKLEHMVNTVTLMRDDARNLIQNELHIACPSPQMVLMTAMALHGKIPSELITDKWIGVSCQGDQIERLEQWEVQKKFLVWYNTLLREHGVAEDLLFYDDHQKALFGNATTVPVYEYHGNEGKVASWASTRKKPWVSLEKITYLYCLKTI